MDIYVRHIGALSDVKMNHVVRLRPHHDLTVRICVSVWVTTAYERETERIRLDPAC
jgi:hypothetical protein